MTKYQRKTKDEFVIEANYGTGWEEVHTDTTAKDCRVNVAAYKAAGVRVRWKRKRVPME